MRASETMSQHQHNLHPRKLVKQPKQLLGLLIDVRLRQIWFV